MKFRSKSIDIASLAEDGFDTVSHLAEAGFEAAADFAEAGYEAVTEAAELGLELAGAGLGLAADALEEVLGDEHKRRRFLWILLGLIGLGVAAGVAKKRAAKAADAPVPTSPPAGYTPAGSATTATGSSSTGASGSAAAGSSGGPQFLTSTEVGLSGRENSTSGDSSDAPTAASDSSDAAADDAAGAEAFAADTDTASSAGDDAGAAPESSDDDLLRIEGIGAKINQALQRAGIATFAALADSSEDQLTTALTDSGLRFHPSLRTWARQAALLRDGDEAGFVDYTDRLIAGRED